MRTENFDHVVFSDLTPTLKGSPPLRPGTLFLRGILALAFAGLTVAFPGPMLITLSLWAGAYFLVDGLVALFLRNRLQPGASSSHRWSILSGVLGIAIGALTFFQPLVTAFALSLLTGAWALFLGGLTFAGALQMRSEPNVSSGSRLFIGATGLLAMALGAWILFQPALGALTLLTIVAANAALLGVSSLVLGYQMRRCLKSGVCPTGMSREMASNHQAA